MFTKAVSSEEETAFLSGGHMTEILERINGFVWGVPTLVLILAVGICLSIRTRFAQFRLLPRALRLFFSKFSEKKNNKDGVTPMQALCTALAATVGTGNLAGVAGAIAIGGPGAVFWMWVSAFLGMITKYAEAALAVRYRTRNGVNELVGGPMYVIRDGLGEKWKWLAAIYSFFGVIAAFGVGNATQINTLISSVNDVLVLSGHTPTLAGNIGMGVILAILVVMMLLGGAKRIGTVAERLVPFAAVLYIFLSGYVLIVNAPAIPQVLGNIVRGAFSPHAVTGGVVGSMIQSLRIGTSRGVFTNEAGMGTAGIAHSAANVSHPAEQGLMGIVEVFLDTIVICTMTALVILCSGVVIPYGTDTGIQLTNQAFSSVFGNWIRVPITLSVCCFAFATILGWGLYGARCAQYLFGHSAWKPFVLLQAVTVVAGAVLGTGTIWLLAETVNGLMAIPNLIALFYLAPEFAALSREYEQIY